MTGWPWGGRCWKPGPCAPLLCSPRPSPSRSRPPSPWTQLWLLQELRELFCCHRTFQGGKGPWSPQTTPGQAGVLLGAPRFLHGARRARSSDAQVAREPRGPATLVPAPTTPSLWGVQTPQAPRSPLIHLLLHLFVHFLWAFPVSLALHPRMWRVTWFFLVVFVNCDERHITEFTVLTVSEWPVLWHRVHLQGGAAIATVVPRTFSSSQVTLCLCKRSLPSPARHEPATAIPVNLTPPGPPITAVARIWPFVAGVSR